MYQRTTGYIAITLGILMLMYTGFNYPISEKLAEAGEIKIIKQEMHFVQWSPFVGVFFFLGGIIIIMISNEKPPKNL
jgi:hypothetical protein